ncbi:TonB-dependent receptor [Stenotrophomonas sp.]|uniref:TonB-dependent receptor n=1 Tax=Stenotrophomonas sp. TaxID=69392 RepID=UPI0028AE1EB9|nr:TonB-dependent receptor [Stenotrophomonas sp.]
MVKRKTIQRAALSAALSLCIAGGAYAQSTTGSIQGSIPVEAGTATTVHVANNSGFNRTIAADSNGRYTINALPVGVYTVTVKRGDQVIGTRQVQVIVGSSVDGSFASAGSATTLEAITVTATAPAAIDLTTTDTRTVITTEQLARLPLQRSAEALALLAPGAVAGAAGYSALAGLVSFGGAGVSENAYYINGYFSGEPVSNLGGFSLPYGAISQQETYTGGYSAKYGRSAGGVINQIGKRGTNAWTFGGQVTWDPKSLREDYRDLYLPDQKLPAGYDYEDPDAAGTLYSRGKGEKTDVTTYSAYVGGPILQDRLFFFVAGEAQKTKQDTNSSSLGSARRTYADTDNPKIYGKIDWNITDDHLLEATWMKEKKDYSGYYREYDIETGAIGDRLAVTPTEQERDSDYRIFKYTGYLTDTLTLSATYGKSRFTARDTPYLLPGVPHIANPTLQNPALNGNSPIRSRLAGYQGRDGVNDTHGLRADLEWVVGDHTLSLGMDNIKFEADNEGTSQESDYWLYQRASNPASNINAALGVGAPGGAGYYVTKRDYFTNTSMSLDQKAWYLEDRWQVTDSLLLTLGLRNDEFTNKNNSGATYMSSKDQWAPRLGFSWDVMGDASLKVFGNAGRYYLAMPNNVAIRGASASTFTSEYFTYTGIDANGAPTGLTPVGGVNGAPPPGAVSSNGEYGTAVDVLSFAPSDLKNMYQDEFILGFDKQLSEKWVVGAKLTYRDLKSSIDDVCDPYTFMDVNGLTQVGTKEGKYIASTGNGQHVEIASCYMFNPGGTNTFSLANVDAAGNHVGGRTDFRMSSSDWGFKDGLKRTYKAIDVYAEHPFDGTWEGRVSYTYSKSEGNNEGQVKSEFGQTNISKTQDWDAWQMMQFANGYLANDRRHQLKLYGSYAITPEWSVGGNIRVQSGTPISCLGYYNPDGSIDEGSSDADPIGYDAAYHTCFGSIAKPGSQRTPWTRSIDLSVSYRPAAFLDGKLGFSLQVFNVLNEGRPLQVDVTSETGPYTVSNTYLLPQARQTPRFLRFAATYDF